MWYIWIMLKTSSNAHTFFAGSVICLAIVSNSSSEVGTVRPRASSRSLRVNIAHGNGPSVGLGTAASRPFQIECRQAPVGVAAQHGVRVDRVALDILGQVLEEHADRLGEARDLLHLPVGHAEQIGHVAGTEHGVELVRVRVAVLYGEVDRGAEFSVDRLQVGALGDAGAARVPTAGVIAPILLAAGARLFGDQVDEAARVPGVSARHRAGADDVGRDALGQFLARRQQVGEGVQVLGAAAAGRLSG